MKHEAYLFAGVAAFFLLTDAAYIWFARELAGIAALTVSFVMASIISFFFTMNYRRKGERPEDHGDSVVQDRSGLIDFFPPHSGYPPMAALGVALMGIGIVYGLWLFLIAFGIMITGVAGMVFQFAGRDD
ncbi:aa3-type cytochrome oxidase subunit IV [Streptantibioticus cattleyicolor]|uniref:cytochrome-c oxidase n=1 Tax=Streptantibioticus cattleyicolor (strain ATCC 35852 / DSM 46488 / JCM 4925 / NBRC 14057 / NRRL 8057) TaxID=1003195 RepID=F8JM34_STREN|nr:cytochrome c oxidase subunit 4 [Streptantibioticus cattleyicolor]AEW99443.1 integral membrane protein [Streptantibioticus cattleyicolor NRRL 8057 = DSM 46488]CCB71516.1 putative cytochrome c oxidase polypeptide 4 [Streptantibioticus cattleyicolor NRRL 8057 = DSM 46488]